MTTIGSVTDDRPTLGSIVGDAEHFLRCAFGQAPWRGRVPCAGALFGIDDVDRIVASAVRVPAIRMVREGKQIPSREFCTPTRLGSVDVEGVADVRKVLDQFRAGATLVLQSLHRTWAPLSAWCVSLEREIGWPVQANAYLTPPGQRGLAPHTDRHDVFAIQLHGRKSWNVDDFGEVELEPDDVLYLPAGLRHRAETEGRPSLHLTVGIHRPTPARIARMAASIAIERSGQPVDTPPDASVRLLRDALADVEAEEVVARLRRPPRTDDGGLLAGAATRAPVAETTRIERLDPWSVDVAGQTVVVRWPNGQLCLPDRALAAIETIADSEGPIAIEEIPGLEPSEQLLLARRLLDERAVVLSS